MAVNTNAEPELTREPIDSLRHVAVPPDDLDAQIAAMPTTAYLVLGILGTLDEELSAVEIKTRADFTVGQFYWSPALSHIRRELNRLRDLGLVDEREVKVSRARSALLYQLSERGDECLSEWVESLPESEPVVVKHPVLLKIWLARDADPLKLVESLDRHIAATQARIDDVHWGIRRSAENGQAQEPRLRYPHAVQGYVLRSLYAEIMNAQQLRDEIARGTPADRAERVHRESGQVRRRRARSGAKPAESRQLNRKEPRQDSMSVSLCLPPALGEPRTLVRYELPDHDNLLEVPARNVLERIETDENENVTAIWLDVATERARPVHVRVALVPVGDTGSPRDRHLGEVFRDGTRWELRGTYLGVVSDEN
jgi:DNA-binding PadR family transcriptional regulator